MLFDFKPIDFDGVKYYLLFLIPYSLFLNDYIDNKSKVQYTIIIKPQLKA